MFVSIDAAALPVTTTGTVVDRDDDDVVMLWALI